MFKIYRNVLTILLFTACLTASAQRMSNEEYIAKYKALAIKSMDEYGIPASIKLAQGMLESGNGSSRLATKGNNHFGIKCKSTWAGGKMYHDDDAKGECFRKYRNVEQSYRDHSKFLAESARYASLFKLDVTDYRGWAYGLKTAGYATNPNYPQLLINIIETNNLHELDRGKGKTGLLAKGSIVVAPRSGVLGKSKTNWAGTETNNGVKYVSATEGATLASIADQYHISLRKVLKYNDLNNPVHIQPGTNVYVQPKKNRSSSTKRYMIQAGDSYHSVAQQYGIKLKSLQKLNPSIRTSAPTVGQELRLR